MATHSSILAWKIPWTEEPGGLQSLGSQRVGYDLMTKQQQSNPSITFHACPDSIPDPRALGLRTSPFSRDQLEKPVLVSGEELGLVSSSKTQQGIQFGPRAVPWAGQFPLPLSHIGS